MHLVFRKLKKPRAKCYEVNILLLFIIYKGPLIFIVKRFYRKFIALMLKNWLKTIFYQERKRAFRIKNLFC